MPRKKTTKKALTKKTAKKTSRRKGSVEKQKRRIGNARFDVFAKTEDQEMFAMAEFPEMSDSAKLTRRSYERETAGLDIGVGTAVGSNVQITCIFYDGVVYRTESDEYVEITNLGDTSQNLQGWVLKDISEGYPSFTFPSYVLVPGGKIRIYTNEIHSESGGFSFRYGKAIWNNSDPDWAALYNAQGQEVSRRSY